MVWESEGGSCKTAGKPTSSVGSSTPNNIGILNVRKSRSVKRISPRPAVVRTTWCDFMTEEEETLYNLNQVQTFDSFKNHVQQQPETLIAEHTVQWTNEDEIEEEEQDFNLSEHINATENVLRNNDNYQDVYYNQKAITQNVDPSQEIDPTKLPQSGSTEPTKRRCKSKRVFQKFWCAAEEDEDDLQELPRPDGYRLKTRNTGSHKRIKTSSSLRRRLLGNDNGVFAVSDELGYREDTDERGGIRRRPKIWDFLDETEEIKKDAKFYAPKRPPPILDLVMVLTSFFAAAVLAYYSAT